MTDVIGHYAQWLAEKRGIHAAPPRVQRDVPLPRQALLIFHQATLCEVDEVMAALTHATVPAPIDIAQPVADGAPTHALADFDAEWPG